ncbi:Crp/Fnr family transcriptional regulator [Limnochorda pilosa]|uniref:Cyclic nucleotide-binding domain-containing protein n=1 Tax=Limnochorda pilosa TaxID=1555112 RepID=A0A0K2SPZ2_LIMPI|nr:Crp/Fnr family transcriptional regulator [Limnochorda pilosa]BAS29156.1 hypothetical protein LIP_3344 [Limnochorda pilosa]
MRTPERSRHPLNRRTCIDRVPVFTRLSPEARAHLARELHHRRFAPGELLAAGEAQTHLTILAAGLARHAVSSADGREQILRFLGPGEFFGEMALFTGRPLAGEVQAVEPVEACVLDGNALRRAVESEPALGWDLLRELARLLEETTRMAGSLSTQSVEERAAHLFLRMAATSGPQFARRGWTRGESALASVGKGAAPLALARGGRAPHGRWVGGGAGRLRRRR